MQRLTQEQAGKLISKAYQDVQKYSLANHRFGQALYNLLEHDLARSICNTDKDFFYLDNDEQVSKLFYLYCVEPLQ